MSGRRVVITGLGIVAPVGLDITSAWDSILAGRSGIQPITHFDVAPFNTRFGGPIYGFDATQYVSKKEARKMDAFIHYGIAAGTQAIEDSGLEITDENRRRIGVAIGSGIGGIGGIESGRDAAQFLLLGCDTVQVCTAVMKFGYGCVQQFCEELLEFMESKGFETLDEFRGHSLQYFTTHYDLVKRQADARAAAKAERDKKMIQGDDQWSGDDFVQQSDALARG